METCKLTRHGCKYAPFNPNTDECHSCVEREEACANFCPYFMKYCDCSEEEYAACDLSKAYPRQSTQLDALEQRVDELSEEYDTVLKTHGDTLEEHLERLSVLEEHIKCIMDYINSKETEHTGSNFCGNCIHYHGDCNIPICKLTGEIVDPDDASCAKYKDSFKSYDRLDYEKPDREECRHCVKPDCSGCSNYPF